MHEQAAGEFLDRFRRLGPTDASAVLDGAIAIAPNTQVGRWTDFERTRRRNDPGPCLVAAAALLDRGPVPSAPFWRAAAVETQRLLVLLSEEDDDAPARFVQLS